MKKKTYPKLKDYLKLEAKFRKDIINSTVTFQNEGDRNNKVYGIIRNVAFSSIKGEEVAIIIKVHNDEVNEVELTWREFENEIKDAYEYINKEYSVDARLKPGSAILYEDGMTKTCGLYKYIQSGSCYIEYIRQGDVLPQPTYTGFGIDGILNDYRNMEVLWFNEGWEEE